MEKLDLVQRVIEKLLAGEKVFLPTNSRLFALYAYKKILEACPNLSIKLYDKTTIIKNTDENGNLSILLLNGLIMTVFW